MAKDGGFRTSKTIRKNFLKACVDETEDARLAFAEEINAQLQTAGLKEISDKPNLTWYDSRSVPLSLLTRGVRSVNHTYSDVDIVLTATWPRASPAVKGLAVKTEAVNTESGGSSRKRSART